MNCVCVRNPFIFGAGKAHPKERNPPMEKEKKNGQEFTGDTAGVGPTPMDDVFRTECVRYPQWVLPILKEIFQEIDVELPDGPDVSPPGMSRPPGGTDQASPATDTEEQSIPALLGNEHPALEDDSAGKESISKKQSDCVLEIGGKLYHLECQSTRDGQILIRMVEYGTRIALEHARFDPDGERLILELPRSALIYLRGGMQKNNGREKNGVKAEKLTMGRVCLRVEGKELEFGIPTLNAQAYTLDEIFEKKLYMLIPFYFLRFEKDLNGDAALNDTIGEMELLARKIVQTHQEGKLSEQEARFISATARVIIRHIMRKYARKDRERMEKTMGGRILTFNFDFDQEEARRMIEERDERLGRQEEELKNTKSELAHNKTELAHSRTELAHNKTELEHNRTELEHNKTELEHSRTELEHSRTELEHKSMELQHKNIELEYRKSELAKKDEEIAEMARKMAEMTKKLKEAGL